MGQWLRLLWRRLHTRPFRASACDRIMATKYATRCNHPEEHLLP